MEAQLYLPLYKLLWSLDHPRQRRVRFNDRIIVIVYLWSVLHDRPVCWACDPANWPADRAFELPEDSTLSRRLRTVGVQQLLERALAALSDRFGPPPLVKQLDSKPLYVGAYSKDPDAKKGRVANGMFARGYRLHTLNHGRIVRQFTLAPMNQHDAAIAPELLSKLEGGGYVLADNAFDSNRLHEEAAAANHQLLAPAREANKGVRDVQHNCPRRLRALDMLDSPLSHCGLDPAFGRELYDLRQPIESGFGGMTFLGLNYVPAWARGPRRVALWAAAKVLIHLCRCAINKGVKIVPAKS